MFSKLIRMSMFINVLRYTGGSGWCFFVTNTSEPEWITDFWYWMSFYIWIFLSILLNIIIFIVIAIRTRLRVANENSPLKHIERRLFCYPLVLVLSWTISCVTDVVWSHILVTPHPSFLNLIGNALSLSNGTFDAFIFFALNEDVMEKLYFRFRPAGYANDSALSSISSIEYESASQYATDRDTG